MEKKRHEGGSEAGRDSCLQVRNITNENQSAGQRPHAASPQQPTETSSKKATRTFPSLSNKVSSSVASAGHEQRSLDDRMSDIGGTLQTLFTPDEREENDRREENDDFRTPTTTTTAAQRGRGVDKENFEIFKSFTEGPPTVGFKRKKTNLSSSRKTPQLTKPSSPLSLGGSGGGGFTSASAAARGDGGGVVDGFGDEGGNRGPLERFIVSQYDKNQKWFRCLQIDRVGEQCTFRATTYAPGSDRKKDVDSCATHAGLKIVRGVRKTKKCTFIEEGTGEQCSIQAVFGLPSRKEKVYCSSHARATNETLGDDEEKYVDVGNKTCTFFDESTGKQCPIQANFGLPSSKERVYCSTHAKVKNGTLRDDEEKYVDVGHKTCTFFDESTGKQCPIQAVFGLPSSKEKVYCSTHAKVENETLRDDEEKYVDVRNKTCTFFDESTGKQCPIRAFFGLPSSKERVYCSTHAKVKNGTLRDDEEKYVDVGHKTCTFFDESTGKQCPIQAFFGLPSTKEKVYCSTHAKVKNGTLRDDEEKYVNVVTKTCEMCRVMPGYYKIEGSVLVREDGVTFIDWKSACWYCATWQNSENVMFNKDAYTEKEGERKPKASKMFMRREHIAIQSLLERIEEDGLNLSLVHNRVIKTGACCRDDGERHRRRLDASIIVHARSEDGVDGEGAPILIGLECDENGHKSYDKKDEAKRVNEIQMAWGVNASVYLRFNPDGYIPHGQTTKRTGFFVRKNEDKKEIDYRLDVVWEKLKELVTHIQTHGPQDSYESVFLFFDGHNDDDFRKRD
ncbi:unnamed protein product [Bathycoccus prasinos]